MSDLLPDARQHPDTCAPTELAVPLAFHPHADGGGPEAPERADGAALRASLHAAARHVGTSLRGRLARADAAARRPAREHRDDLPPIV